MTALPSAAYLRRLIARVSFNPMSSSTCPKGSVPKSGFAAVVTWCWHRTSRLGAGRLKRYWNAAFDLALGIDTVSVRQPNESTWPLGSENEGLGTIDYINLNRLVAIVKPKSEDVFVDIGCGRGRVLCVFARTKVKRVLGVEILESLAAKAMHNAGRLRGRRCHIDVVRCDAVDADLSSGTIYFMFNPFGEPTLRSVLDSIRRSVLDLPRSITIVYYHPKYLHTLEETEWIFEDGRYRMFGEYTVSIWKSRS